MEVLTIRTATGISLLCLSAFGFRSLHIFAAKNGLFERFLAAVDKRKTPSGEPITLFDTGGRIAKLDWQLLAPAVFILNFTEDLGHPDTTLAGFLFLGAWAPAWCLMLLESFRACNKGHLASWAQVPGLIIFNHSHAVGTPLYLGLMLLFAPSTRATTAEDLQIDLLHLGAMPFSFIIGYVLPIILMSLKAPQAVSLKLKYTIAGWYQQWNVYVALFHYLAYFYLASRSQSEPQNVPKGSYMETIRSVYFLAFLMAAIPWWIVAVISCAAWLAPSLFNPKKVESLKPWNVFVPASPFVDRKCRDMQQGFKWLIEWDYAIGSLGTTAWAWYLYETTSWAYGIQHSMLHILGRYGFYAFLGGPVAVPIGMMWERESLVFGK